MIWVFLFIVYTDDQQISRLLLSLCLPCSNQFSFTKILYVCLSAEDKLQVFIVVVYQGLYLPDYFFIAYLFTFIFKFFSSPAHPMQNFSSLLCSQSLPLQIHSCFFFPLKKSRPPRDIIMSHPQI